MRFAEHVPNLFIMENTENKYQKSIDMLNDAVRKEIASSLQYMYFHVHLEDAGYEYLARYLHKVSIAEMRHIEMLAERIMFLEGDVDMNPHEPTRRITDVSEMLGFAMKIEQSTIDSYNEYSRIASEAGDSVTHRMFQDLVADEEEHLDNFRTELQNMKDYGEMYLTMQSVARSKEIAGK